MRFRFHLNSLLKERVPPAQEEIEQHLRRLNELLLASQQVKSMSAAEWMATEREIEMELQWFDIHHLKLTSTWPTAVYSLSHGIEKPPPSHPQSGR